MQVIGTNIILLPEAVCCCSQTCQSTLIMVRQCTKFHCSRTHHKLVIGTNICLYCLRLFFELEHFDTNDGLHLCTKFYHSGYLLYLVNTLLVYIIMYGLGLFFFVFCCLHVINFKMLLHAGSRIPIVVQSFMCIIILSCFLDTPV